VTLEVLQFQVEALPEQWQQALMTNLCGKHTPECLPVNSAEEVYDVGLKVEFIARSHKVLYALNSSCNTSPLDECKATIQVKLPESRLDEERNRFHYNPVANARDLQWSCLTRTRLFDCVGAKFIEYVCACPEIRADFGKIFLKPALESFNRYIVQPT